MAHLDPPSRARDVRWLLSVQPATLCVVTPIQQFDRTIQRVDAIVAWHRRTYAAQGRPPQEWSDVLRGALVLAVAALDGLVDDLLLECVPQAIISGKQGATVDGWVEAAPNRALQALADTNPAARSACGASTRRTVGSRSVRRRTPMPAASAFRERPTFA